jgi:hypothetical protein
MLKKTHIHIQLLQQLHPEKYPSQMFSGRMMHKKQHIDLLTNIYCKKDDLLHDVGHGLGSYSFAAAILPLY